MKQIDIESFLSLDGYDNDIRVNRRKSKEINSQEFFSPFNIVKKMGDKIPEEVWRDPSKNFCEPCFGNGQFVVYIVWKRLVSGIDWETALRTLWGVELMEDNVYETHKRITDLMDAMDIDYDEDLAMDIMLNNLVHVDFFKWDFENWKQKI